MNVECKYVCKYDTKIKFTSEVTVHHNHIDSSFIKTTHYFSLASETHQIGMSGV